MSQSFRPLADRLRPVSLADYVGQAHLVGPGKPIARMIETGKVSSMILWGPPGVGKTTLARILARSTRREFYELSAVSAGKDELRKIIEQSQKLRSPSTLFDAADQNEGRSPVLFLDEIHRFNKAQQDFLLPYVEDGTLVLIGATTENPSFEVISALLSRCRVFTLQSLEETDIAALLSRGANELGVELDAEASAYILRMAGGDARQSLALLDQTAELYESPVTKEKVEATQQSLHLRYDKKGEEHYNVVSAFIKSMRASNADAALYYLARMVEAGEDPKFIARRMVIFASEDVGLADSNALAVANAVFRAVEIIGYPECSICLGHGVVYLALAPKSRRSYDGIKSALQLVRETGNLEIPLKLRNAPTGLMKQSGYGKGYQMYGNEELLPDPIRGKRFLETDQNH